MGVGLAISLPAQAQHASSGHASAPSGGAHFSGGSPSSPHFAAPSAPSAPHSSPSGYAPRYAGPHPSAPPVYRGRPQPVGENHRAPEFGRAGNASPSTAHSAASRAGTSSAALNAGLPRPGFNGRRPNRGVRLVAFGRISPLGWWLGPYQFYPWLDADLSYDYWHDTGDQDTAIAMASTGANAVADSDPAPYPNGGDPYATESGAQDQSDADAPANWTATQVDTGAPALTLVYKTGKTEQVANYVVSRSAVTVIDDTGVRSVPVADLDLTTMAKANSQAGLQLPEGLQP
jgi:hypothetical protein